MPVNRSTKADDQRNESRFKAQAPKVALNKMARYPASLNKINKNLP
ncbi:hypothetical protein [Cohnella sp. CFH 77786]|nr:hypothetical protein [Cohnella sp. CFH 77786]